MILRRLDVSEHGRTRPLYEEVFSEDDKAFVDYYYEWKTRDNKIYVAEDEDGIHAMVHLNPFRMYVQGELHTLHYIVAVATQEEYRHRGLMRSLLALAEKDMKEAGETFTFLMPASEKIYAPFGYRYFCMQRRGILRIADLKEERQDVLRAAQLAEHSEKNRKDTKAVLHAAEMEENDEAIVRAAEIEEDIEYTAEENATDIMCAAGSEENTGFLCRPVLPQEYGALATFVNRVLEKEYDIFVYRDEAYYERLCAEQSAQGGDVMVIGRPDGTLIGTFCTSRELSDASDTDAMQGQKTDTRKTGSQERCELREVILDPDYLEEGREALTEFAEAYGSCKVLGYQPFLEPEKEEQVPLLMGKRPGAGVFCSRYDSQKIFINEVV